MTHEKLSAIYKYLLMNWKSFVWLGGQTEIQVKFTLTKKNFKNVISPVFVGQIFAESEMCQKRRANVEPACLQAKSERI